MKPKLLVASDGVRQTGFARATHGICDRLKDRWDISLLAINYSGDPHPYEYDIYPALAQYGLDFMGLSRFVPLVRKIRPDAILIQNDPWNVQKFLELPDRPADIPVIGYMPVDSPNMREAVAKSLHGLRTAVWYTDFARKEAEKAGYKGPSEVVPLGVDLELYQAMPRREARERLHLHEFMLDAFIVGNVNSPNPRKRLDLSVRYFAQWVKRCEPKGRVFLYLHALMDERSVDFHQLAAYYGIGHMVFSPRFGPDSEMLAESSMPLVYNSLDVQINTGHGEGFGLCQAEGMACRVPQIAGGYSGLADWAAGACKFVPCTGTYTHNGQINTIGGVVDEDAFVEALDAMYKDKRLRNKYATLGNRLVRKDRFRWDNIAERFHDILTRAVGKAVAA